ncbi:MAG: hypothetical protein IIA62_02015 [Nitrospinae bacterium]|nr:hypothetical protein [Nitrospinota bacterium]
MNARNEGPANQRSILNSDPPVSIMLLGASNLSRGYHCLTRCLKSNLEPRPVSFRSALGPGRGYCSDGGFLNVTYPPIKSCQFLSELQDDAEGSQKVALITDLGNDIMYGIDPDWLIVEIKNIHRKLLAGNADMLITPIPSTLVQQLTPFVFKILKRIFYPRSKVKRLEAISSIERINAFIEEGVGERVTVIRGLENFTGWDRIHYDFFRLTQVWTKIAEEMLKTLDVPMKKKIKNTDTVRSYLSHLNRMMFSDISGLIKKGPEFF